MQSIIYYNTICESESPTIIIVSFAKLVMDRGYGRTSGRKRFHVIFITLQHTLQYK